MLSLPVMDGRFLLDGQYKPEHQVAVAARTSSLLRVNDSCDPFTCSTCSCAHAHNLEICVGMFNVDQLARQAHPPMQRQRKGHLCRSVLSKEAHTMQGYWLPI